ncbi:MAG: SCO family protein [Xanthomonadaceae bacterium]|nr:SCO family protein [Xanthomonadaceae bacterium]
MTEPRQGRMKLIALAALFVAPLAIAWLWFGNIERFTPTDSAAHGELIAPAQPLGGFALAGVAGGPTVTAETLHGRWTIVQMGGAQCDETCRESLWEARQVHTRLGRDAVRVQRLYVVAGDVEVTDPAFFADEHPDLLLARIDAEDAVFSELEAGHTYLVDPLGNLMMRYGPDAEPKDLLADLKRLLRVSRIG